MACHDVVVSIILYHICINMVKPNINS